MRVAILSLILALIVVGCISAPGQSQTKSTLASFEVIKTFTPTLDGISIRSTERIGTVVALQTASITPLSIAHPSITPLPITLVPKLTNILRPIDYYLQKIKDVSQTCRESYASDTKAASPHTDWVIYDCSENRELFIVKPDGSIVWQVRYAQLSSYNETPDNMRILHWSGDRRYVYFVPSYGCCWDPGIAFLGQALDELWQFDVITGVYINIMMGFDDVSFSPDDKTVLLIPQMSAPPPVITIYDLETHQRKRNLLITAFPKNPTAGGVVWAPNGKKFAFLTASGGDFERYNDGDEYKEALFSVIVVDVNTFTQKVIVSESKKHIGLFEITDANILLFASYETVDNTTIRTDQQYDLKSNKFIMVSTPNP